jgi:hypothetical protein
MHDCHRCPNKHTEVALPFDKINAACAYEKMPNIGVHPRGIHLWRGIRCGNLRHLNIDYESFVGGHTLELHRNRSTQN